MDYRISELAEQVTTARANYRAVEIVGGGSKRFYGNRAGKLDDNAFRLSMAGLDGIIHYEPSELVLTAWAGTSLEQIEQTLAQQHQMLAFDPPHFGGGATLGGAVASGLSGPASFGYGPLRHYVLGTRLLDAQGRILRFGGEVMKNVAGYDVSRLLAGSMGIFGALVEVSIKVMPEPVRDETCALELSEEQALDLCRGLRARTWPVKAAAWLPDSAVPGYGTLCVRLAGAAAAVASARQIIGGELLSSDEARLWWNAYRDQTHEFFKQGALWRLAVRAGTPALNLGQCAFDMGAEVRWLVTDRSAEEVRGTATQAGGHATLFRPDAGAGVPQDGVFHPLQPAVYAVVRRIKGEFDPKGIFNAGRLVQDL